GGQEGGAGDADGDPVRRASFGSRAPVQAVDLQAPLRIVYLGTPEMAVPPLRAVHESGHEVVLVVSGADKRRGRGKETSPSPVKAAALELGLDVTADPQDLLAVDAD